ncbi:MAG: undecaprenyldiphospho-muramoylpentapeptide beta-N-acetylglucosaminyltransferase [Firmicutes bacterium]|nr:undecaprenyldiphospho-muramoylpentapeptide beta-N-acetylglucosaminyltransferase [Bacillota bacterium]
MKAILSCAGTGGHIYPAIAIADTIRRMEPDADILFIGTKHGMENRLVPQAGFAILGIDASGFNRKNLLKNFKTALDLARGSQETVAILKEFEPDVVIGTGGYVTGTVVRKAAQMGIPCYIHEQNVVPGMANKLLEKYVEKVFISFEGSREYFQDKDKLILSGNPIRRDFLSVDTEGAREQLGLTDSDFMILITGGSLGAEVPNMASLDLIRVLAPDPKGAKIFFVTGKRYYDEIKAQADAIEGSDKFVKVIDYADNMPVLMSAADLIVSRAGAIALSEITASGKPSILIPSPNVTNNHQYFNAKSLADAGAAVLIEETELQSGYEPFTDAVQKLMADRVALHRMVLASAQLGRTDAVDIIYKNIKI